MSFDEKLAARVRRQLKRRAGYAERKMFGGLCFMLHGNMCGGVLNDDLIVRVKPDEYAASLKRPHTRKFDFTGRPLKGIVVVRPKGCCTEKSLTNWIVLGTRCALSKPAKTAGGKRRRK
jgi:TfoX/Sxy family transcriptional regulator of competence genes